MLYVKSYTLNRTGLQKLIKASYHILGLMSFLTAGEDETRAWTIRIGTKAPQAAGKIHTAENPQSDDHAVKSDLKTENLEPPRYVS